MTFRNISLTFWTDSKIDDEFTPEDKYFYLYLLTNPHTSICGCYEISMKQMERETGYNADTCYRLLDRMERVHNVIRYSRITKEVLILNWHKYNWTKSEKLVKAIESVSNYIKNDKYREYIKNILKDNIIIDIETETESDSDTESDTESDSDSESDVCIGYRYRIDTVSETETKSSTAPQLKVAPKRFIPPTVENVRDYCLETGKPIDAEAFVDFYSSKGWKVGSSSMKDWKAAVRNWRKRDEQNGQVYERLQPQAQSPTSPESSISIDDCEAVIWRKYQ